MSWSEVFLGVIALATLLMSIVQVSALVAILAVARKAQQSLSELQRDVRPLLAKANAIADQASHTATVASPSATAMTRRRYSRKCSGSTPSAPASRTTTSFEGTGRLPCTRWFRYPAESFVCEARAR